MLELPLLSTGAVAAVAGRGGTVPLPDREFIKIGELFTILELKNVKKDSYDICLTYNSLWSPLRKPETFPLMLFSASCVEHIGDCTPALWHLATPSGCPVPASEGQVLDPPSCCTDQRAL